MKKKQNQKPLKIKLIFHPVTDWDARLNRVLELLIRRLSDKDIDNKEDGGENA